MEMFNPAHPGEVLQEALAGKNITPSAICPQSSFLGLR